MNLKLEGVQLTAEDYLAAQRLHSRWRTVRVGTILFLALFVIGSIGSSHDRYGYFGFVGVFWTVWFVVVMLSRFLYMPWRCRRSFRQHKALQGISDVVITDEAIASESSYGSTRMPWDDYYKWKSNDQVILLYQSPRLFNIIPSRCLQASDYAVFRQMLGLVIGPEGKARKAG